jgi:DNA-binding SARP family transcriptional activator
VSIVVRRTPERPARPRLARPVQLRRSDGHPSAPTPTPTPTIRTLGRLAVEPMGPGLELRLRVRELLGVIVSNRAIPRDTAACLLWPDKDLPAARSNLRVTLSHLMRVVEGTGSTWITSRHGVLAVDTSLVRLDVDEFTSAEALGRQAERTGRPAQAVEHYTRALDWYGGQFLAGVDVDGVHYERLRLEALAFDVAIAGARAARSIGEPDRAASFACTALSIDPLGDAGAVELAAAVRAMGRLDAARSALGRHADELRRAGISPAAFIDTHVSHLRIA